MNAQPSRAPDSPWRLDDMLRAVEIGGATWSFIDTGGSGPSVVLLPGSVGTCEVFFKQIAALGESFRIVAATYPGLSDPAALADGLAGFVDALGLNASLIAGSSFAAYWLQFFALRHPQRVRRLLLGNGFVEGEPLRAHPLFAPSLILDAPAEAMQRTWRERIAEGPESELRQIQLDMLSGRQSAAVLQSRLQSVVKAQPCPKPDVPADRLVLLDCDDDAIITPPMRAAMRERYPGAALHSLPFGGHYPHLLNPDGYNALIRRSVVTP